MICGKFGRCLRQKNFQIPKSKTDEISLPFSGDGPKMANLDFRGKMPKMAKIMIFPKISPRKVSVSNKGLGIDLREVWKIFDTKKFSGPKIQN